MALVEHRARPSVASRRAGYVVAAGINAAMLYLINLWPGWQVLPFLTDETPQVLGLVNASIAVGIALNLVYALRDPVWLKAFGDLLTTAVGLAAMWAMWRVFPFDFAGSGVDWALVVRVGLVVGMVGSAIAMIVHVVRLVRAASGSGPR